MSAAEDRPAGPIPLLYCIDSLGLGGTERQLLQLIDGLDRSQFEPHLCTLRPWTTGATAPNCPVIEIPFVSLGATSILSCVGALRSYIRRNHIRMIQTFFQDSTQVGLLASIGTAANVRIASFRDLGFWRTRRVSLQMRAALRLYDGYIANSRAVAAAAHAWTGVPVERIEVIYNGVRLPEARPGSAGPVPTVGTVANLNRWVKRVDLFIQAAAIVRRTLPTTRFLIVGDGELRQELMLLARQSGLGGAVEFVGRVADVTAYIAQCDVGVLCSDSEGLSNSILEFMSAAVPVVARDVGGNGELVSHGHTGLLVSGDHADAIASAIVTLLSDAESRRSMGAKARQAVRSLFAPEVCVRRHEDYYCRFLTLAGRSTRMPCDKPAI